MSSSPPGPNPNNTPVQIFKPRVIINEEEMYDGVPCVASSTNNSRGFTGFSSFTFSFALTCVLSI